MIFETNSLFAGDALTLLERLPSAVVTLTYLDPPWNTAAGFSTGSSPQAESLHEQHIIYLSKVVQQVYRVLTDVGSVFIHCSTSAPFDVRLVMNQAFGSQPSYEITWHRKGLRQARSKGPRVDSEFILVYSKSREPIYNPPVRSLLPHEAPAYSQEDERGRYMLADLTVPFERPSARFAWRGYQVQPRRSWRFGLEKLEALSRENLIYFPPSGSLPRLKQYLDENASIEISTTWDDIPSITVRSDTVGIRNQKPLALLNRIVQLASNEGDRVLDPFIGSGTSLVAAHSLGRLWWGVDNSDEALRIVESRLLKTCSLEVGRDYAVYNEANAMARPAESVLYKDVITSVKQIAQLKRDVNVLTDHLLALKRLMNIGEDDTEERVEAAIQQMAHWITISIAKQERSVESYIPVVQSWLPGWDQLEEASRTFLPQAELLFELSTRTNCVDYSPFVVQYCRALENELLAKLFASYTNSLQTRYENVSGFLASDIDDEKTATFAKYAQQRKATFTLGEMVYIMGLIKVNGKTLQRSPLLRDFRNYLLQSFSEEIVTNAYLDQIGKINQDFRRKAAHPYILDAEAARNCRDLLRSCLNELISNYRGGKSGSS